MRYDGGRSSSNRSSNRLDASSSNRPASRKLTDPISSGNYRYRNQSDSRSSSSRNSSSKRYSESSSNRAYSHGANSHEAANAAMENSFLRSNAHSNNQGDGAFRFASYAWEHFKIPVIILMTILLAILALLIAFAVISGKYVKGTHIGALDVSDMTVQQATDALLNYYNPNLEATKVYVFADEASRDSADLDLQLIEASAQAEQISFEEAKANEKLWIASAETLGATFPAEDVAINAKEMSDSSGFLERIGLFPANVQAPVFLSINDGNINEFVGKIDDSLGTPVKDYTLEVIDGVVYIDQGRRGKLMDREAFKGALTELLLTDDSPMVSYVANMSSVMFDINKKKVNRAKDAIEKLVPEQVVFASDGSSLKLSRNDLLRWVSTEKEYVDGKWLLKIHLNSSKAAPKITAALNKAKDGKIAAVSIDSTKDGIKVYTDTMLDLYDLESGLSTLENEIFGTYNTGGKIGKAKKSVQVDLAAKSSSNEFSLDDALNNGIVVQFSSYTTRYANTTSTANRTKNIHLAAERLDNSIAKADGGIWSFNDVVGSASAEDGFLEANVIDGNTITTGVGGGICQVATTVFNSVYEAGLPIAERHNHSLYTSSYPAGRDAAIAYPYLDLRWRNDTDSDILLTSSYTDDSITVTLIGVNPERKVDTETGQWEKGSSYKTLYELDNTLGKNASYVKQNGIDGMNILVTRTSKDSDGSILSTDYFQSAYAATDRVIAYGKKSDMNALKEKYEKKAKTSSKKNKTKKDES